MTWSERLLVFILTWDCCTKKPWCLIYYIVYNYTQVSDNAESATTCSQMEPYSGEVCRDKLVSLQLCFFDTTASSPALNIPTSISQDSSEEMAMLLVNGLTFFNPSEECLGAILPFLCLTLFPLCDPDNNVHTISREDCLSLRDEICVDIWRMAVQFLGPGVLPICENLPDISNECINSKLHCCPQ